MRKLDGAKQTDVTSKPHLKFSEIEVYWSTSGGNSGLKTFRKTAYILEQK